MRKLGLPGGAGVGLAPPRAPPLGAVRAPPATRAPPPPWVALWSPVAFSPPRPATTRARLKVFSARQWKAMPAGHFMAVFGPYAVRADEVIGRFDPAVLATAAVAVAGADEEIPLRPEEHAR